MGKYGKVDKGATNHEMIKLVRMICGKCEQPIIYRIEDECSHCGFIAIKCDECKYEFHFGE